MTENNSRKAKLIGGYTHPAARNEAIHAARSLLKGQGCDPNTASVEDAWCVLDNQARLDPSLLCSLYYLRPQSRKEERAFGRDWKKRQQEVPEVRALTPFEQTVYDTVLEAYKTGRDGISAQIIAQEAFPEQWREYVGGELLVGQIARAGGAIKAIVVLPKDKNGDYTLYLCPNAIRSLFGDNQTPE